MGRSRKGTAVQATQIRQKDGIFYFVSYRAKDLLARVRFISRFYGEHDQIPAARRQAIVEDLIGATAANTGLAAATVTPRPAVNQIEAALVRPCTWGVGSS